MALKIFVTGTDTDAGKTYISTGLLNTFNKKNFTTLGLKPIASGCTLHDGILYNTDGLALQQASSIKLPYHAINPFAFEPPIAPHIAARRVNCNLSVNILKKTTNHVFKNNADIYLVEGAGGWYVPLNHHETMADYVKAMDYKVILVIGIRLGCINHAILTHKAIASHGIPILGWIANCIDPKFTELNEVVHTLENWLSSPCLGMVGHNGHIHDVINTDIILS